MSYQDLKDLFYLARKYNMRVKLKLLLTGGLDQNYAVSLFLFELKEVVLKSVIGENLRRLEL